MKMRFLNIALGVVAIFLSAFSVAHALDLSFANSTNNTFKAVTITSNVGSVTMCALAPDTNLTAITATGGDIVDNHITTTANGTADVLNGSWNIKYWTSGFVGCNGGSETGEFDILIYNNEFQGFGEGATSTRIVSIQEPLSGAVTSSNSVLFDFTYYYNDTASTTYQKAGIEVTDVTAGVELLTTEIDINASGYDSYAESLILTSAHSYVWKPYLRNTSTEQKLYGTTQIFSVVSNPAGFSPLTDPFATSTATSSSPLSFLNLPVVLASKYPFSYVPQIITLVASEATLTGTSTFPSLVFDFTDTRLGSTTLGLGEIEFFGTSTIAVFLEQDQIDTFKTLTRMVLWVGFIFAVIFDARKKLLHTKVT